MDEEAPLLPDAALTRGDHTEVLLAPLAAATRALDAAAGAERLLGWARWALLSIALIGVLDLAHEGIRMLVDTGRARHKGTATDIWLKRTRKEVGKSQTKVNQA